MLKVINTKLLIAILAALAAIGAVLIHIRNASERSAQILQQQQNDIAAAKKRDAQTWEFVRKQNEKHNADPAGSSKTWTHYLP